MHHVGRAVSLIAAVAASCACVEVFDSNASQPPDNPSPYNRSETSLARVRAGGADVLIAAYNDQSGFFRIEGDTLVTLPNPTFAGLSVSRDDGRTWERVGPLPPNPPPGCPDSFKCIQAIASDPWVSSSILATGESHALYTILASNEISHGKTNVIAAATSTDGLHWTDWQTAVFRGDSQILDKPSNSMFENHAAIAFVDPSLKTVGFATSGDYGATWSDHGSLNVPLIDRSSNYVQNPIVKLTSGTEGYLAYLELTPARLGEEQPMQVHLVRIALVGLPDLRFWRVTSEAFVRTDLGIHPNVNRGANLDHSISLTPWHDGVPMSFAIGNIMGGGPHLYLAWREDGPKTDDADPSAVMFADCLDDDRSRPCSPGIFPHAWNVRPIDSSVQVLQYQPVVTAEETSERVAVAWYQGAIPPTDPDWRRWTVHGVFSEDGGLDFSEINFLRPNGVDWEICSRPSDGYYGDYMASIFIPGLRYMRQPWIVTAHSDSSYTTFSGCETNLVTSDFGPDFTVFDQHVQAVVW